MKATSPRFDRFTKVTLLAFASVIAVAGAVHAGEPETLLTTNGHRFEKATVTEVTPATITIRHSTGLAHIPLSEFPPEVQKRFGYDPAKAQAWLAELTHRQAAAATPTPSETDKARTRELMDRIGRYIDSGGRLSIDPRTGRLYDPDVEEARRSAAIREWQRTGQPPAAR